MTQLHTVRRVCVVGAGVSGVVAAAHLHAAGVEVTVFERSSVAGGVWVYDERTPIEPAYPSDKPSEGDSFILGEELLKNEEDPSFGGKLATALEDDLEIQHAPPGPAYLGLKNNVGTRLMKLKLGPWKPGTEDFISHRFLKEYIQDTARKSGVDALTMYNTRVNSITKKAGVWHVGTTTWTKQGSVKSGSRQIEQRAWVFDAVVVCSGHYHACRVPDIPGLREWKTRWPDRVRHSKGYRKPDGFKDQKVLLVGAGVSSTDIARELGGVADHVYQSSRNGDFDLPSTLLPPNGTRIGEIASFDIDIPQQNGNNNENVGYDTLHTAQQPIPSTITLASGHKLCGVHSVLVCTGYHISYPFLRHYHNDNISATAANDTVIVTDGTQVHNLHKDIFYIPDPTLSFIGAPYYTATFTLFEFQAIALAAVLSGRAALPSQVEMRREYCAKLKRKGAGRHFNSLKDEEVDYVRDLVAWVNRDADRFGGHIVQGHTEEWHVAKKEQLERLRQIFGEKDKDRDKERNGELLLNGSAGLLLAPCT